MKKSGNALLGYKYYSTVLYCTGTVHPDRSHEQRHDADVTAEAARRGGRPPGCVWGHRPPAVIFFFFK